MSGVVRTRVGFTGGTLANPTYRRLGNHIETVDIDFDPSTTNYQHLLDVFWKSHNPTSHSSSQYMSAIFYHGEEQREMAQKTKEEEEEHRARPVITVIKPADIFYNADNYHQKYMLRRSGSLLASLNMTDQELIISHVAARLNGYVAGQGHPDLFEKEWPELGLTAIQVAYIRRKLAGNR